MKVKLILSIFLLMISTSTSMGQRVSTLRTSTGYFYPLGTTQFNPGCPSNGGTWLGRDKYSIPVGCYLPGYYHIGYDMFNSSTVVNSPVFAVATGKVIYIDPGSSWNNPNSSPYNTVNTA